MKKSFFKKTLILLTTLLILSACTTRKDIQHKETSTTKQVVQISKDIPTTATSESVFSTQNSEIIYVLNRNTKKIHRESCSSVKKIKETNKSFTNDYEKYVLRGYEPCKRCYP